MSATPTTNPSQLLPLGECGLEINKTESVQEINGTGILTSFPDLTSQSGLRTNSRTSFGLERSSRTSASGLVRISWLVAPDVTKRRLY